MKHIAAIALLSLTSALLFTPLIRNWALARGWVDLPDNRRKCHITPVPRVGGIPIMLSFVLACLASFLLTRYGSAAVPITTIAQVLPAAIIVFAVGLADDLVGLRPWQKLAGQLLAASLACLQGVQIHNLGAVDIQSQWWHVPLTLFWLVGCTNAFNLIDGVDGLAAGIGSFAALTILVASLLQQNLALALATAPLAGALFAFLRYNFNPATIFLGDCGSLTIGFLLGCYGVEWSQHTTTILGMTAPLLTLFIPLFDTTLAIARRFVRGRPIFAADRCHIHHRLLERGLSVRRVALLLYGAAAVAAVCALLIDAFENHIGVIVLALFCLAVWLGLRHLGYAEFSGLRRVLLSNRIRRMIDTEILLGQFDERLKAAGTIEDCWPVLRDIGDQFHVCRVEARLNGQARSSQSAATAGPEWNLSVPLAGSDYVRFWVPVGTEQPGFAVLVRLVHRNLQKKVLHESHPLAAQSSLLPLAAATGAPLKVARAAKPFPRGRESVTA